MKDLHAKSNREYPVEGLCRLFGKTKQAYYKYNEQRMMIRMTQESFAVEYIKDFIPTAPNQLWVSDITYITIFGSENHYWFCYLTMIMDAYSEEVKGYCVGDPRENPQAERINSTIKNEILMGCVFHNIKQVKEAVTKAIEFYNNERPHMSIGMMTPVEASRCSGERDMKWISYRERAIKRSLEQKITEKGLPLNPCHGSPSGLCPPVNP